MAEPGKGTPHKRSEWVGGHSPFEGPPRTGIPPASLLLKWPFDARPAVGLPSPPAAPHIHMLLSKPRTTSPSFPLPLPLPVPWLPPWRRQGVRWHTRMWRHCVPRPAGKCSFKHRWAGTVFLSGSVARPWFRLLTLQTQRSYALKNLNVTIVNALFYCWSYFSVTIMVFVNIYYVSGPGFMNFHKLSHSILPVIPPTFILLKENTVVRGHTANKRQK